MLANNAAWANPSCNMCPVKGFIFNNGRKYDGNSERLKIIRLSTGMDSLYNLQANNNTIPIANNTANMPFQPMVSVIAPPMTGANTGAIPFIDPVIAIIFVNSCPVYKSVQIERAITILPAAAIP